MEKRFKKVVKNPKTGRTKTVKYGQAGKAKDGGDRIRPGTAKGDAYCARSAKIKGDWKSDPNSPNNLSRRKWRCKGSKSMKWSIPRSRLYLRTNMSWWIPTSHTKLRVDLLKECGSESQVSPAERGESISFFGMVVLYIVISLLIVSDLILRTLGGLFSKLNSGIATPTTSPSSKAPSCEVCGCKLK